MLPLYSTGGLPRGSGSVAQADSIRLRLGIPIADVFIFKWTRKSKSPPWPQRTRQEWGTRFTGIGCFPLQGACGTGKKVKVRVKGGGQECPLYTFSAKGKGRRDFSQRPLLMPATTYSPTHFRVQYNRPCGA